MPQKFGDGVTLIQKSPDGSLTRVSAIVLASRIQPDGAETLNPKQVELAKAIKDHNGPKPGGEYLDLAIPTVTLGQTVNDLSVLFRRGYAVPEWYDGSWIGWEDELGEAKEALNDMGDGIRIMRKQLVAKDAEIASLKETAQKVETKG